MYSFKRYLSGKCDKNFAQGQSGLENFKSA